MATGSGAGRIQKAQAQLNAHDPQEKTESRFAGKVLQERKGEPSDMYDSRYDIGKDAKGREVIQGEWLYKEGARSNVKTRKVRT